MIPTNLKELKPEREKLHRQESNGLQQFNVQVSKMEHEKAPLDPSDQKRHYGRQLLNHRPCAAHVLPQQHNQQPGFRRES